MYLFKLALWSCLASALAARAVRNITIDDFDSRIVYSDPSTWKHENSAATLDRFNLTTSFTGQQALASIKFNGTAVYFMSYGLPLPYPEKFQVTVDGRTVIRSLRVSNESERAQFMAYSRTGLDISTEHQITISNPNCIPLNIDAFIITVPDNSTMKDGFGSTSEATTDTQSNGSSGLSVAAKTGIAIACIGGILLGLLGALGISYWKRQRESKSRLKTSDFIGRMERGGASAAQIRQATNGSVFPYVAPAVQPQDVGFRKGRRPNGEIYRAPETQVEMGDDTTTLSGVTSPHPLPSTAPVSFPPPYAG